MTAPQAVRPGTWTLVAPGDGARFTVRKLGLIRVSGRFTVVEGTAVLDAAGRPVSASAALDAASFATGNARRDTDVRGPRFLDAAAHPRIGYRAVAFEPAGGGWTAHGELTVRGRTAPLELAVEVEAVGEGVRLTCRGVLDRAAAGVRAPRALIGRWVAVEVTADLVPGD